MAAELEKLANGKLRLKGDMMFAQLGRRGPIYKGA